MKVYGIAILCCLGAVSASGSDAICFEAESAGSISAPLQIGSLTNRIPNPNWHGVEGASGGKYVEIPDRVEESPPSPANGEAKSPAPLPSGEAVYTFEVPRDATYFLWCRVWWADECGNSFTMSFDKAIPFTFGEDGTFKFWHWVKAPQKLKQLELSKGKHTLAIRSREDGVRLDQILLTTDRRDVPVDIEAVTSPSTTAP